MARGRLSGWLGRAADLFFPPHCAFCQELLGPARARAGFCQTCEGCLPWITPPLCTRCGIPFESFSGDRAPEPGGHRCGPCIERPPLFDRAWAATRYEGPVREQILALKYGRRLEGTGALVELLRRAWERSREDGEPPALICPVPLHLDRLRERHFDQARLLARRLSRTLGQPAALDMLCRTRPTTPQTELPREKRRANVRGAFAVQRPERARGRLILLIDDVVTTGATASECAGALKRAGASRVHVLSVARAVTS